MTIFRCDRNLPITIIGFQSCEYLSLTKLLDTLLHWRQCIGILDHHRVEFTMVKTETKTSIFLLRKKDRCGPFENRVFATSILVVLSIQSYSSSRVFRPARNGA